MAKYNEDFKIEVARAYLSTRIGARSLAAQSRSALNNRILRHSDTRFGQLQYGDDLTVGQA